MARHRNIRNIDYDDHLGDYDELAQSYDDHDFILSPTCAHYMFRRNDDTTDNSFGFNGPASPEHHSSCDSFASAQVHESVSNSNDDINDDVIKSAMEAVESVIGDNVWTHIQLKKTLLHFNMDTESTICWLLDHPNEPLPKKTLCETLSASPLLTDDDDDATKSATKTVSASAGESRPGTLSSLSLLGGGGGTSGGGSDGNGSSTTPLPSLLSIGRPPLSSLSAAVPSLASFGSLGCGPGVGGLSSISGAPSLSSLCASTSPALSSVAPLSVGVQPQLSRPLSSLQSFNSNLMAIAPSLSSLNCSGSGVGVGSNVGVSGKTESHSGTLGFLEEKENVVVQSVSISSTVARCDDVEAAKSQQHPLVCTPSIFAQCLCFDNKGDCSSEIAAVFKTVSALFSSPDCFSSYADVDPIVVPFSFDTPSPDDYIRSKQAKTFVRGPQEGQMNSKLVASPVLSRKGKKGNKYEDVASTGDDDVAAVLNVGQMSVDSNNSSMYSPSSGSKPASRSSSPAPPRPLKGITVRKSPKIDVLSEISKRQDKPLLHLVVIGHVDAGKSTIMGHLLYLLGNVAQRTMTKFERESKKAGKSSFAFAWVLDATDEERERGITMDVAQQRFDTVDRRFVLLDAPGHRDFIPNMITGASQADVGMLVVDASGSEFEAGFDADGQTKEHAVLARSLGITQLVVAVNKLDCIDWSESRFNEIRVKLLSFLQQTGYRESGIFFVPCSGLTGENLLKQSAPALCSWYQGLSLVDTINSLAPPKHLLDLPLRLCVADLFRGSSGTVCMLGKIESGHVQVGSTVVVVPSGAQGVVKTLDRDDESVEWAAAGDSVSATIVGVDIAAVSMGSVLCEIGALVPAVTRFLGKVIIFCVPIPITKGAQVLFHSHNAAEPAHVSKLISILNKSTGDIQKKKPRVLPSGCSAVVEVTLERTVALDLYKDFRNLGRFMLRARGVTVAAGIITEIIA